MRNRGEMLRRLLQALARGTSALRTNPDAGINPLLEANKDLDRPIQEAQLKATLPTLLPDAGRPYGWQEPADWRAFAQWMQSQVLIRSAQVARRAYTNEFLPGEGI